MTPQAAAQVAALEQFYIERQRAAALRNLGHALAEASVIIVNAPERGMPAPRPYPELEAFGFLWIKRGRYWIAFDPTPPIVVGVFFETDDIPDRVAPN